MKTTKTLILAARIFMSLGIGTAMAQNLTVGGAEAIYVVHNAAMGASGVDRNFVQHGNGSVTLANPE